MIGLKTKLFTTPHENLVLNGVLDYTSVISKTDGWRKIKIVKGKDAGRIKSLGFNGYTGPVTISGYVYSAKGKVDAGFDVCDSPVSIKRYDGTHSSSAITINTTRRYFIARCESVSQYNTVGVYNGFLDFNTNWNSGDATELYFEDLKIEKGDWTEYTPLANQGG